MISGLFVILITAVGMSVSVYMEKHPRFMLFWMEVCATMVTLLTRMPMFAKEFAATSHQECIVGTEYVMKMKTAGTAQRIVEFVPLRHPLRLLPLLPPHRLPHRLPLHQHRLLLRLPPHRLPLLLLRLPLLRRPSDCFWDTTQTGLNIDLEPASTGQKTSIPPNSHTWSTLLPTSNEERLKWSRWSGMM